MPGVYEKEICLLIWGICWNDMDLWETSPGTKELVGAIPYGTPPTNSPQHRYKDTFGSQCSTNTPHLACLQHTSPPCTPPPISQPRQFTQAVAGPALGQLRLCRHCGAPSWHSPRDCLIQYTLGSPKEVPQGWQYTSCPNRGQHHFKVTLHREKRR